MKILEIPHNTADYLCPVNGLCDIYEWKTGERIPEKLVSNVRTGFMFLSNKRMNPPKMIFMMQMNIGKQLFEFWSGKMRFNLFSSGGKTYKTTLSEIKELIDSDIPVILFGLDMYYLSYHDKFYQKVHIPGHVVLMVGYDDNYVYVFDNSKEGIQKVNYFDLEKAWEKNYYNISKKNTYYGIQFIAGDRDTSLILQEAYREAANNYLNPKLSFCGAKGLDKLTKELSKWNTDFSDETLKSIYMNYIRFSGSILPELPAELDKNQIGLVNAHQGLRDELAASLDKYKIQFGNKNWLSAAEHFYRSGKSIEKTVNEFVKNILMDSFAEPEKYRELFLEIKEHDQKAFMELR